MSRLPEWIGMLLRFASFANIVWGLTLALVAEGLFRWAHMEVPELLLPWRMLGMLAIIFGVTYYLISFNPVRGILALVLSVLVNLVETSLVVTDWITGPLTYQMALYFASKDLLWLGPLVAVLYLVFKEWQVPTEAKDSNPAEPLSQTLSRFTTSSGGDLAALSYQQPVLLIFLRHYGCLFCQESLLEIVENRSAVEAQGVKIVLVHMSSYEQGQSYLRDNKLSSIDHISDPDCHLYYLFRLKRASLSQVLGVWSLLQGARVGLLRGYGLGKLFGDGFRMPGIFLLHRGELLKSYKYQHPSDRPNYVSLANWSR